VRKRSLGQCQVAKTSDSHVERPFPTPLALRLAPVKRRRSLDILCDRMPARSRHRGQARRAPIARRAARIRVRLLRTRCHYCAASWRRKSDRGAASNAQTLPSCVFRLCLNVEPPAPLRVFNRTMHLSRLQELADLIVADEELPEKTPPPIGLISRRFKTSFDRHRHGRREAQGRG